jgi:type II restriction/modification system DNA methylase subunit YeeA
MRAGGWFGPEEIRFFDGRLFDDNQALELDGDGMHTLARISRLDWSSIEPSIFGTLFERSLDPSKRSQLGAHYTSREDIELIVEPVLMNPLKQRWEEIKEEVYELAKLGREATTRSAASRRRNQIMEHLLNFSRELADIEILDPACGSGNFLYVALRQLLDLEKEVIILAGQLGTSMFLPNVSPEQLHGIETNPYAQELAQVTIWIGYIQWMQDNGYGFPKEPILEPLDAIQRKDAVLAYDEDGNLTEPEWPEADVIIGNPPFLGDKKMRGDLGDEYVDDLRELYEDRIPGQSDFVCYWFEKARAMVANDKTGRVGLLATQAIRGGANQTVLERIKETGDIFWAWSDRNWILDGATVHVSMVGFDDGDETWHQLNGKSVNKINADLTSRIDLTVCRNLEENSGVAFIGIQKSGPFDIANDKAEEMFPGNNPHGRSNKEVIKHFINATDVMRRPRGKWIIDFGIDMPLEEAAKYEAPFEYVREYIKPKRNGSGEWWLFTRPRPDLRDAIEELSSYIVTPRVSKHRVFALIDKVVISNSALVVFAREDYYFLGVLQSGIHEKWARATGTQLREATSGFRYSQTLVFETFPFPWPPGEEPDEYQAPCVRAIAEAARELVEQRQHWLKPGTLPASKLKRRTLTNLYNQNPTWLQLAHKRLDNAVLDAYGWPHDLQDEEILERLLELNLERAKNQ